MSVETPQSSVRKARLHRAISIGLRRSLSPRHSPRATRAPASGFVHWPNAAVAPASSERPECSKTDTGRGQPYPSLQIGAKFPRSQRCQRLTTQIGVPSHAGSTWSDAQVLSKPPIGLIPRGFKPPLHPGLRRQHDLIVYAGSGAFRGREAHERIIYFALEMGSLRILSGATGGYTKVRHWMDEWPKKKTKRLVT